MENKATEPTEYRYTDLIGEAIITLEDGLTSVTLLDAEVNPNKKPLFFDPLPLKSAPEAKPTGSDGIPLYIEIIAGLNRAWFIKHTEEDGFRFKGENEQPAQAWEELEVPDEVTMPKMDPVRPVGSVAAAISDQNQPAAR